MVLVIRKHPALSAATAAYALVLAWFALAPHPLGGAASTAWQRIADAGPVAGFAASLAVDVLLFVPLGALALALLGRSHGIGAVATCGLASCWLEVAQWVFAPDRGPSVIAVFAQVLGAAAGAALVTLIANALLASSVARMSRVIETTAS